MIVSDRVLDRVVEMLDARLPENSGGWGYVFEDGEGYLYVSEDWSDSYHSYHSPERLLESMDWVDLRETQ